MPQLFNDESNDPRDIAPELYGYKSDADWVTAFLYELAELEAKYHLVVGGCGDCGSPWIEETRGGRVLAEYLAWNWTASPTVEKNEAGEWVPTQRHLDSMIPGYSTEETRNG